MKKILVTRKLLKENEDKLSELFEVKLNYDDKIYSAQEIIDNSKLQIFPNSNIFRESEIPIFSEILNYFQEI